MQMIYIVPFVFIFIFIAAIYSMNKMSRWNTLVDISTPVPARPTFVVSYLNNAIINGFQFNAAMKIGMGDGSIFLQPIFPLSITMPAVFIPLKLLKPLGTVKNGMHQFSIDGTDVVIGISGKWSSKVLA